LFTFPSSPHPRDLHSFPTRRSSDLSSRLERPVPNSNRPLLMMSSTAARSATRIGWLNGYGSRVTPCPIRSRLVRAATTPRKTSRSEEHTSELQSLAYLVCRLLLEKK